MANLQYIWVPYSYVATSSSMASNAANQIPLLLDQDADFELHKIWASSTLDAATEYRPNHFSVQITDKNNSRIWSNARVQETVWSQGYELHRPVLLAKRSNINFDFLNLDGSSANIATITFDGYKVYMTPGNPGMPTGGMPPMGQGAMPHI